MYLKDALLFFRHYWLRIAILTVPVSLGALAVLNLSQADQLIDQYIQKTNEFNQQQLPQETPTKLSDKRASNTDAEYEGDTHLLETNPPETNPDKSADTREDLTQPPLNQQESQQESQTKNQEFNFTDIQISPAQIVGFIIYALLSLVPTALIVKLIQSVQAESMLSVTENYHQALQLWLSLIRFYVVIFAIQFGIIMCLVALYMLMPSIIEFIMPFFVYVIPIFGIYCFYRLSFVPMRIANTPENIRQTLRHSWFMASTRVAQILFGSIIIYIMTWVVIQATAGLLMGIFGQNIIFESLAIVIGSVLMSLQTIYYYRLYTAVSHTSNPV